MNMTAFPSYAHSTKGFEFQENDENDWYLRGYRQAWRSARRPAIVGPPPPKDDPMLEYWNMGIADGKYDFKISQGEDDA